MVQAENRSTMVQDKNKNRMAVAIALRMCGHLLMEVRSLLNAHPAFLPFH